MHRLLRRQLETNLGPDEPAAELRALLREVDAEYRRADADRGSLQRALELLADLTRRQAEAAAPAPASSASSRTSRLVRRLFDHAPFAAIVCDPDLNVLAWNGAAAQLFGFAAAEAVGRELGALLFPEVDRAIARRELRELVERGEPDQSLRVSQARSGAARLDEWTVVPLRGADGRVAGAAVLAREPFATPDRHAVACQATGDGIFDWDVPGDRLWLSDAAVALLGAPAVNGRSADWLDRVHPADREDVAAAVRAHLDGATARFESEHRLGSDADGWRWVLARGCASRDAAEKPVRFAGSLMDVTARRAAAEQALHDALHDPLTRLPNRALFVDLVKRAFARLRRREAYAFAVVFLDLDRFKAVNDGLGHAAGDELLALVAERLQTCLREGDTLARHGGDEFTILLDDVKGPADALIVADRIHEATGHAFEISGRQVFTSTSIGIALSTPSYVVPDELLRDADTAMYRAKAQGRGRTAVFDGGMRERAPQLLHLEGDLRRALQREEFRVHYMPVVDVATGRIQGLEALVRWAHPTEGLVAPERFVPFAEETGLIVPIGRWLLRQAGRDFNRCRRVAEPGSLSLHVNLSCKQLLNGELLDEVDGVVQEHQLDPGELSFEMTEPTLGQGPDTAARLTALRGRGVRVCMDDFGAGCSSLSALHRVEVDTLKIDRSLFTGGAPSGRAPELVRSIVSLARNLGKPVVAEGVETADQFYFLRGLGCAGAQGFYFSRPVDGDAARSLVASGACW